MDDNQLRKIIGQRIRQRRKELGLTQQDLAEKMGVNKSSIMRYEKGQIDNTKKLVLQGFSGVLHVTPEWLRSETDELPTAVTDHLDTQIADRLAAVSRCFPLEVPTEDDVFARNILLSFLEEYIRFTDHFTYACANYSEENDNSVVAKMMGMESSQEYNSVAFSNAVTPMINTLSTCVDALRIYGRDPEKAQADVRSLKNYLLP